MDSEVKKRIEWIDFLKGIAALLVMLSHFWLFSKNLYNTTDNLGQFLDWITDKYIDIGKIAVTIFFLISGYLTANVFYRKNIKQFIVDRIKRMYPIYWLSIILSLILIRREELYTIIINATMFQQFVGVNNIVGAFWTLQIDWIFYFLCIFLAYIKKFNDAKTTQYAYYTFLGLSLVMGILRFYTGKGFPVAIGILISVTFLGIMIKRSENNKNEYKLFSSILLFFVILFPTVMLAYTNRLQDIQIGFKYFVTYVLAFIIFFIAKKYIKKKNLFVSLGKISYSMYLIHPTIGFFVLSTLFEKFEINIYVNMLISIITTIIFSKFTNKYIENILVNKCKKNDKVIYINGRFLTQKITGVQRYAIEVVKELDKMNLSDEIIILHPNNIIQNLELQNIKLKKVGKLSGQAWEQISLPIYLKRHNAKVLLSMCNLAPVMFPGYVVIHDIAFKTQSEHLDWKFALWYKIVTRLNIKRYKHIFTVSEFSKKEIMTEYHVNTNNITVTYNSAEHITKVKEDESILKKLNLKSKEFNFSLGSRSYHKNTAYIIKLAKANKDEIFVISGMKNKIFNEVEEEKLENVIYTGYISDNELVCLYKNCKSFIFPSLYEGFGIPPLEALELGCKNVCVSNIPVHREIYGNSVNYVDVNNKNGRYRNIEENIDIHNKYRWIKVAEVILDFIKEE